MPVLKCPVCKHLFDLPIFRVGTPVICDACGNRVTVSLSHSEEVAPPDFDCDNLDKLDERDDLHDFAPIYVAPGIDDDPKIDEDQVVSAALKSIQNSRITAYCVAVMTGVVFFVALSLLVAGASVSPALILSFTSCMTLGLVLWLAYLSSRSRAFSEAVAQERRLIVEEYWARKSASSASVLATLVSVVGFIFVVLKGVRFGAALQGGRMSGYALLLILGIFGAAFVVYLLWRSFHTFSFVRVASFVQIVFAVGCSVYGITEVWRAREAAATQATIAAAEAQAAAERAKEAAAAAARRAKEEAEALADAKVVGMCIAPENIAAVRTYIKAHGRDKVAFVEIDNTRMTNEHRNELSYDLGRKRSFVTYHEDPDRRAIEVVFAPVDNLEELAKQFEGFGISETDPAAKRIKTRPDIEKLQATVEFKRNQAEFNDLSGRSTGNDQMLDSLRIEHGREHLVVVNVVHSNTGVGREQAGVYSKMKPYADVLRILRLSHTEQRYVIKTDSVDDLARKIAFGTVIEIDTTQRSITVDLDIKNAKPFDPKPTSITDVSQYRDVSLRDFELQILREKYGNERVVQVDIDNMPDDSAERDFVRRAVRDGKETFYLYSTGRNERFLVAPVDDFENLNRNLDFINSKSAGATERKIRMSINIDRVRLKMAARLAASTESSFEVVEDGSGQRLPQERTALRKRYGDRRVVEVQVYKMPDDPAERDFVRRRIGKGKEICRSYVSKSHPQLEKLLVAPVENFGTFAQRLQIEFVNSYSADKNRESLFFELDMDRMRQTMLRLSK